MRIRSDTTHEIAPGIPKGLELGLRSYWYPLLLSEELTADRPVSLRALGSPLVAFRDENGKPRVLRDRCPHRGMPLSGGAVLDGRIQCPLHGLRFDGSGACSLIPWEPDDSPLREKASVAAYPTEELGGYVWSFMRPAGEVPPPPLVAELPQELSDSRNFIYFRFPTEIWNANWLLAIDGSDPYHAVTLHANTQAVRTGAPKSDMVPFSERRVRIVDTPQGYRGIAVDRNGQHINHGHVTRELVGDRFALGCTTTTSIVPATGAAPYAVRLWQYPIDANTTRVQRIVAWRAETAEARDRITELFNTIVSARLLAISAEDKVAAEAQGDLVAARSEEQLFWPDRDVIIIRKRLKEAFLAEGAGERIGVPTEGMVFPILQVDAVAATHA